MRAVLTPSVHSDTRCDGTNNTDETCKCTFCIANNYKVSEETEISNVVNYGLAAKQAFHQTWDSTI
jgi:hypothetical protein